MSKYLELVKDSFTQEHFDKQAIENKPYVAYSIKDKEVIYTIIPKEDGTMYTIYRVVSKDISNCTYNMVDLGLSVKWADRNVGASSPEHCGSYFQWGEIVRNEEGKPSSNAYTYEESAEITTEQLVDILNPLIGPGITVDNVKDALASEGVTGNDLRDVMKAAGMDAVSMNKEFNWDSYNEVDVITGWDEDGYRCPTGFKKYNNNGGLTVLESSDDAATVHMGTQYRMPTSAEIQELISGTTQTFIDVDGNEYSKEQADNGVIESGKLKGVKFTSRTVKDDNNEFTSIFIPAAGACAESLLGGIGMFGILWSSSLGVGSGADARSLNFGEGSVYENDDFRYYGLSVRGVEFIPNSN
jgi:hypothetical protein